MAAVWFCILNNPMKIDVLHDMKCSQSTTWSDNVQMQLRKRNRLPLLGAQISSPLNTQQYIA